MLWKYFSMITAAIFITSFIIVSLHLTSSTIKGLSVTVETREGRVGDRIAGSFHILNQGESFGRIEEGDVEAVRYNGYCGADITGFTGSGGLRFESSAIASGCNDPADSIHVSFYNSGSIETLTVGGRE